MEKRFRLARQASTICCGPSPQGGGASFGQTQQGVEATLPRQDAGGSQPEQEREEQNAPPGQFVSDEHEADCSRFLEEVKEFVRRRNEAGLSPWRQAR